jgi:hypothetical protein
MSELVTDIRFSNGQNGTTPNKLNLAFSRATVSAELISNKTAQTAADPGGYLLELTAAGTLVKLPTTAFAGGGGAGVDPGTWTALTYASGWTQNTTAQFRVETNGSFQKVISRGIINYASGAAALAFTLPAGARPSVTRGCMVAGFDSSGDAQLFQATVATSGAVNIVPMVRQGFSWSSATNGSVYLDGLTFSL